MISYNEYKYKAQAELLDDAAPFESAICLPGETAWDIEALRDRGAERLFAFEKDAMTYWKLKNFLAKWYVDKGPTRTTLLRKDINRWAASGWFLRDPVDLVFLDYCGPLGVSTYDAIFGLLLSCESEATFIINVECGREKNEDKTIQSFFRQSAYETKKKSQKKRLISPSLTLWCDDGDVRVDCLDDHDEAITYFTGSGTFARAGAVEGMLLQERLVQSVVKDSLCFHAYPAAHGNCDMLLFSFQVKKSCSEAKRRWDALSD